MTASGGRIGYRVSHDCNADPQDSMPTQAFYRFHSKRGEEHCDLSLACKAHDAHNRRNPGVPYPGWVRKPPVGEHDCSTPPSEAYPYSGFYQRHLSKGELPCDYSRACHHMNTQQQRHPGRPLPVWQPAEPKREHNCSTPPEESIPTTAFGTQHRRAGETPCDYARACEAHAMHNWLHPGRPYHGWMQASSLDVPTLLYQHRWPPHYGGSRWRVYVGTTSDTLEDRINGWGYRKHQPELSQVLQDGLQCFSEELALFPTRTEGLAAETILAVAYALDPEVLCTNSKIPAWVPELGGTGCNPMAELNPVHRSTALGELLKGRT